MEFYVRPANFWQQPPKKFLCRISGSNRTTGVSIFKGNLNIWWDFKVKPSKLGLGITVRGFKLICKFFNSTLNCQSDKKNLYCGQVSCGIACQILLYSDHFLCWQWCWFFLLLYVSFVRRAVIAVDGYYRLDKTTPVHRCFREIFWRFLCVKAKHVVCLAAWF